jgi:hypothetical protein
MKREEAAGVIDAMKRIVKNSLKSVGYEYPEEEVTEKVSETVELKEGMTATGPKGEKLILREGKWQPI